MVTVIHLCIYDRLDQITLDYLHHIKPPTLTINQADISIFLAHVCVFFKRQTKMLPPLHQTTGQKKGKGHVEYEKGWWWKKGDNPISYGMYVRPFFTVCAVCGYHPPRVC